MCSQLYVLILMFCQALCEASLHHVANASIGLLLSFVDMHCKLRFTSSDGSDKISEHLHLSASMFAFFSVHDAIQSTSLLPSVSSSFYYSFPDNVIYTEEPATRKILDFRRSIFLLVMFLFLMTLIILVSGSLSMAIRFFIVVSKLQSDVTA